MPAPTSIPARPATAVAEAFEARDFEKLDALALRAYGLKSLLVFDFVDTRK